MRTTNTLEELSESKFPPIVFLWVGVLCVCLSLIVRLSPFGLLCAEVTFAIGRTFKSKSYPHLLTIFMLPKSMLTCKSMDRSACSDCGGGGGGMGLRGGMCVCTHVCMCLWGTGVCVHAWVTDAYVFLSGNIWQQMDELLESVCWCLVMLSVSESFCFLMHYGNVYLTLYFKFLEIIVSCLMESWIPHLFVLLLWQNQMAWSLTTTRKEGTWMATAFPCTCRPSLLPYCEEVWIMKPSSAAACPLPHRPTRHALSAVLPLCSRAECRPQANIRWAYFLSTEFR